MSRAKVEAVVENWFPRFLANGLDYLDVRRTLDAVEDWSDWSDAWTRSADHYAVLGERARVAGRRVTAAEHLRRAALTLQFAQFVLTEDLQRRRALQERQVVLYATAAPLLDPPAERLRFAAGAAVGYLRRPSGMQGAPLVVLLPGLESTKEQFSTYEPYFLRRGVATLSVEGPGQGEAGFAAAFESQRYAAVLREVAAEVGTFDSVDTTKVVVLGTSFGGYLALRHATVFDGLRGIVDIAGPFDLADFDQLQTVTQDSFREFVGAADLDQARQHLGDISLQSVLADIAVAVLVVHGERDNIIPVRHAHRIAEGLGQLASLHIEADGNHSCQNLHTTIRPLVADWVAEQLGVPG